MCNGLAGVIMIFSGSMEFEKRYNQEVQERPSDNVELPKVIISMAHFICSGIMKFFILLLTLSMRMLYTPYFMLAAM